VLTAPLPETPSEAVPPGDAPLLLTTCSWFIFSWPLPETLIEPVLAALPLATVITSATSTIPVPLISTVPLEVPALAPTRRYAPAEVLNVPACTSKRPVPPSTPTYTAPAEDGRLSLRESTVFRGAKDDDDVTMPTGGSIVGAGKRVTAEGQGAGRSRHGQRAVAAGHEADQRPAGGGVTGGRAVGGRTRGADADPRFVVVAVTGDRGGAPVARRGVVTAGWSERRYRPPCYVHQREKGQSARRDRQSKVHGTVTRMQDRKIFSSNPSSERAYGTHGARPLTVLSEETSKERGPRRSGHCQKRRHAHGAEAFRQ